MTATDYRNRARAAMGQNWNTLALIALVYTAITAGVSAVLPSVGSLVVLLVEGPFLLSWAIISLGTVRGAVYKVENLFDGFKNFVPSFLLNLVNGIFVALWSLLFVIPGIVKAYSYSMSTFILAENPRHGSGGRPPHLRCYDGGTQVASVLPGLFFHRLAPALCFDAWHSQPLGDAVRADRPRRVL